MPQRIDQNTANNDLAKIQQIATQLGIGDVNQLNPQEKQQLAEQIDGELKNRQQQSVGQTIQGVGQAFQRDVAPVFDPTTGAVSTVSLGGGAKQPSQLNELIALQTAKTKQELSELDIRKKRTEVEKAERGEAFQKELEEKEKGKISPEVPSIPTDGGTPLPEPTVPTETPPPQFRTVIERDASGNRVEKKVETQEFKDFQKRQGEKIKTEGKRAEEESKANINFEKTVNLFSGIVAQVKGREEEQGGLGLIPGLVGEFNVAIKNPEFSRTASAFGQRAETAFAMNSVLTGQNRVIRGVINMILKSLPDGLDPDPVVAAKTAQSIRNAFMITRAFRQAGLTKEVLSKMSQEELNNIDVDFLVAGAQLSPEEEAFIEAKINAVLATPPAKERFLRGERGKGIEGGQINIKSITQISE